MRRSSILQPRVLFAGAALLLLIPVPSGAAPVEMSRDEIICLSQSGVGFSYWWGHGAWCDNGCAPDFSCAAGSCSGSCPSCDHSGSYGADCSGFVAKVWQVPSPSAISDDTHPYSTQDFRCTTAYWSEIDKSVIEAADALTYRDGCPGSSGHVLIFESGDPWGSAWTYEARGCSTGIVHNNRTVSSSYIAIRRDLITTPTCVPAAEVCDGVDNDCDGAVDEDYVPFTCGAGICVRSSTCEGGFESCSPGLSEPEVCDGIDNNCDGAVDEGDVCAVPVEEEEQAPDPGPPEPWSETSADDGTPGDTLLPEAETAEPLPDAGAPGLDTRGVTGGCGCVLAV